MKLFRNIIAWWRDFLRKRRFAMLNATDRTEEWHIHLSPASIFAAFVSFVLILFIIVLSLVAYTPVQEFLPGYRTDADRARENLVHSIIRLDSMERLMNDMLTYNQNIALIMEGKTPVARTLAASDSVRTDKSIVAPSRADSVLRAQMEGDGPYSITSRNADRATVRKAIELVTPVEGIITDRFDILQGRFGVHIAAAVSDRVTAIDNGTVIQSVWTPENGFIVTLQHNGGLLSVYKNMSRSLTATGQTIRSGELIGYTAEVRDGEIKLFEFELWNNGKPVDPEGYIVF